MDELRECARAAAAGDPVAVTALVRATQRDVRTLCAHLVDDDAADDLAQETYVRALRSLPSFEGRAPFRLWLLSIARRTCADEIRRRTRRRRLLQRATPRPEHAADASESTAVTHLLAGLDDARREAFVLTQVLGLPYAEAAEVTGVPIGTIRSRVARARDDLQRRLQEALA